MSEHSGRRWFSWGKLACLALTLLALSLVFRRMDRRALELALLQMRPAWFILSVGLCGAAFLLAAMRWHLALGLTRCAVHLGASVRLTLIGHYLVLVLFGGFPGDVAKSSLYARWYRLGFPEVFAASPLDRLLGLGGLVLFGACAFGFAAGSGGWADLPGLAWRWPPPWTWVVLAASALGMALLLRWKPRGNSAPLRLLGSIQAGASQLLRQPRLAGSGLAYGVVVQFFLSGVLAANVLAITGPDLPWAKMLWTFPVISLLGGLPVTVAGLGVREGSALLLLGLYNVSPADAVAASLLSLVANLFWGGVGGALFWQEDRRQQRAAAKPLPRTISVVLAAAPDSQGLG